MVRTIVSFAEEEKDWLDRKASEEGVPMAALVRRAVRRLREESDAAATPLEELLDRSAGTWPGEDGLSYQRKLRAEWPR